MPDVRPPMSDVRVPVVGDPPYVRIPVIGDPPYAACFSTKWTYLVIVLVLIVIGTLPGVICYYRYYLPDHSCDRYVYARGWVSSDYVERDDHCGEVGTCWSAMGTYSFNLTTRMNETRIVLCKGTWTLHSNVNDDYDTVVSFVNVTLGTFVDLFYDKNDLKHCFLDHCERSCNDWKSAFWVPWFMVVF